MAYSHTLIFLLRLLHRSHIPCLLILLLLLLRGPVNRSTTLINRVLEHGSTSIYTADRETSKTWSVHNHTSSYHTSDYHTLIRFPPVKHNENINDFTFDNVHLYPCTQPQGPAPGEVEDLMCLSRPDYLSGYKNPCYLDETKHLQCLPYYFILGFGKCATTDLTSRLQAHPAILKNHGKFDKETFYWSWRRFGFLLRKVIKPFTLAEYTTFFTNATNAIAPLEGQPNQPIVGDGSPCDGWDFRGWTRDPQNVGLSEPKVLAPQHMRHIMKEPKFIFLMREPTERLYSDYFFHNIGDSPEKFAKDAARAVDMMNACMRENTTRQCFYSFDLHRSLPGFIHAGCYSLFLREWLSEFHRKHFLFLRTEDYEKDMKGNLRAVFSFLGVDTLSDSMLDSIVKQNRRLQNDKKKTAGPMFEETRKLLQEFYAPCNQDLADLFGDDRYLWLDRHH
ncbi:hypothetical protein BsWGS_28530 [Bradybaena similaris]